MIGNKFLSVAGASEPTDAQFNYVTMLLHGDGTNGAQNNTFLDGSTNNFTITRNGNTTQGSFSPYGSLWSDYFATTGSYLSVPYSSDFNLTGDFTIEFWMNPTNLPASTGGAPQSYCRLFSFGTYNAANSLGLEINSNDSGNLRHLYSWYNAGIYSLSSNNAVTTGSWQHIAMVRSGTVITLYINGVSTGSTITGASAAVNTGQSFYIATLHGFEADSSAQYNGFISNFSILKGTAKYTANFTPSTTPLPTNATNQTLLTCVANRFIDSNTTTTAKTITVNGVPQIQRFNPFGTSTAYSTATIGGSGYNPGATGLKTTYSGSVGSTDDFTAEGWFYITSNADNGNLVLCGSALGIIMTQSGQKLSTYFPSTGFIAWQASALVQNTWHYIVVQRSSSTLSCYLNGTRLGTQGSATGGWTYNASDIWLTGQGSVREVGYYTDIRISTIARYSGTTMTVPTAPLTSDANTTFLLSMTNAAIYDNAMMNDLETLGNAQISTSVKKYGTGSIDFGGGSGNYLKTQATPNLSLGTGDFTVEAWFYLTDVSKLNIGVSSGGAWQLGYDGSGGRKTYVWNGADVMTSSTSITVNTWNHIAWTRSGSTMYLFLNGTQVATVSNSSSVDLSASVIGTYGANPTPYPFYGYIDDLRITKGYARYTTTFTPPTAALPDKGPI